VVERVSTPKVRTIEEVCSFLKADPADVIKTLVFDTGSEAVVALVRGDHDINEIKLKNYLNCNELELADEVLIEKVTGAPRGFAGPAGLSGVRIIADYGIKGRINMITGGNELDVHIGNVNIGRDFNVEAFADIRLAVEGDACPRCAQALTTTRGSEVGHILKLGTKYSTTMHAEFLDVHGKSQPMVMGCYGIGVGRTVAAAIEQSHDKDGIIFPAAIAPFTVLISLVNPTDAKQNEVATNLYKELLKHGVEVLLDDRDERPGIKFKDADLIGIPLRVTVGRKVVQDSSIDIKWRKTGEQVQIAISEAASKVLEALPKL